MEFLKFEVYFSKIKCPGRRESVHCIVLTKVPMEVRELPDEKPNRMFNKTCAHLHNRVVFIFYIKLPQGHGRCFISTVNNNSMIFISRKI